MRKEEIRFNFLDRYYLFYNWLKDDKVIKTNNYKLVKVSSKALGDLIKYNVRIDGEDGICVYSDSFSYIAIMFEKGVSKAISSLLIEDEEKLKNRVDNTKYVKIYYEKESLREADNTLRYLEEIKKVITSEVDSIKDNEDMLKYIYFEWFSKKEDNLGVIIDNIKDRLEKGITYKEKEIYDLLLTCKKGV